MKTTFTRRTGILSGILRPFAIRSAAVAAVSGMTLCAVAAPAAADTATTRTNVLLIISDDLNDWIGPMGGHPQAQTPNLDKLAARGVTFTNAQCPAPVCNPSRTAFMSGMRPSTTGIYHNQQPWMPHIGAGLCINDYVRKFGYTSLGAGKIYHYRNYRPEEWDKVVFPADDTLPNHPANRRPGPFGYRMFTEGEPQEPFNEKRAESELADAKSVSWCIEQLAEVKGPFFMACGIHRPHLPWDIPKKYFDRFPLESMQLPKVLEDDLRDVPPQGKEFATSSTHAKILEMGLWKDRVRAYLANICYMDAQVGRLLDALEESPYADNTVIVFVGDNGWHLGTKQHWAKVTLWNDAARVPLIWVAPGTAKAGAKCEKGVDLMSLYPTICELTGIPTPGHAEGVSIKPLLTNPAADWKTPGLSTMYKGNHSLLTADWRYTRYADGTEELYNQRDDPREWSNVAAKPENADIKKKLSQFLPKKDAEPVKENAAKPKRGRRAANAKAPAGNSAQAGKAARAGKAGKAGKTGQAGRPRKAAPAGKPEESPSASADNSGLMEDPERDDSEQ